MILLQETTNWDTPNHIYVVTDDKQFLYGYYKREENAFSKEVSMLKKPIRFYTKGRTFKILASGFNLK